MTLHRAIIPLTLGVALMAACGDDDPQMPTDSTSPARVVDLAIVGHDATSFTLRWTAPGDDGASGTASSYRLKRSDALINATNFSAATTVGGVPAPSVAGSVESFTVTGLDSTLTYYFALRAVDEAGNVSSVSNNAVWTPGADVTPPAMVVDLSVDSVSATSITLTWTAPGDDGNTGTASSYQLKRSGAPINAGNFGAATTIAGVPAPSVAGSVESFEVTGLDTTLTYYFALRTVDDASNVSLVSNNAVWEPAGPPQHLVKNIPPFKDNTMYEEGDFSNGAGQHIFTGRAGIGNPFARRALLAFAIADSLPAGAVVDSVRLTLHLSKVAAGSGARVTALHRLTADWGEGTSVGSLGEGAGAPATTNDVTWVYRFFNTVTWTASGGDFVAGVSAQRSVNTIGFYTWSSAGMAVDVQGWLDTPANNFGWIMVGDESVNTIAKRFDSRENSVAANRPKLTVYYTVP